MHTIAQNFGVLGQVKQNLVALYNFNITVTLQFMK